MASNPARLSQLRAAEQLNVEVLPGTEVMKDVNDVHFAHSHGADSGSV